MTAGESKALEQLGNAEAVLLMVAILVVYFPLMFTLVLAIDRLALAGSPSTAAEPTLRPATPAELARM
jgi:hypothetical protein